MDELTDTEMAAILYRWRDTEAGETVDRLLVVYDEMRQHRDKLIGYAYQQHATMQGWLDQRKRQHEESQRRQAEAIRTAFSRW